LNYGKHSLSTFILYLNKFFRRPNVQGRESGEAYSRWEHEWGLDAAINYLEPSGDLEGKKVLDVGCGLGGKTVAYVERGAKAVFGADIMESNAAASQSYAAGLEAVSDRSAFLVGDAAVLPFEDEVFDTVVANDAMEHFARPGSALAEMRRVTRPGGAIWIFFTPHYSPLGSHLYDYIYTPWCHLIFTHSQIESAIRESLLQRCEVGEQGELDSRLTEIMRSYDEDLNHMSVQRFFRLVAGEAGLKPTRVELRPAKFRWLAPLTRLPMIRELVTGFVVCRLERT
jgi:ubiquinone/menaquinone biosynthesis C-methylase UbiE